MVWFHGGAFTEGSSFGPYDLYDGSLLATVGDVVVVTCNYRLGAFGSLVHSGGIEGNFGFKDQRQCLEWVQAEIHVFGGSRTNVTIWGQSAGAQSVFLHIASAGSKGLFTRAIMESACDLSVMDATEASRLGAELAKEAGCRHASEAETIACLKAADADAIVAAAGKAESSLFSIATTVSLKHPTASFLPFKPHVDGVEFTQQPFQTIMDGTSPNAVPVLIGFNHDEMWALLDSLPEWVQGLEAEAALAVLFDPRTARRAWEHYGRLYPGDTLSTVSKILTDYVFTCSSQALAMRMPSPSYVYQFNHIDSFGPALFTQFGLAQCANRSCHEAEIPFVFGNTGPAELNMTFTPAEMDISRRLQLSFTAFAHGRGADWTPFSQAQRTGLVINITAKSAPLGDAASVCAEIWDLAGYVH